MTIPNLSLSLEKHMEDGAHTASFYLNMAIKATSNLPKGLNRTAIVVAFMQSATSDYHDSINMLIEKYRGSDAN